MVRATKRRFLPNIWVLSPILILLAAVVWMQGTDGYKDNGVNNLASMAAVVCASLVYVVWFVTASGHSQALRGAVAALAVALVVACFTLVRRDGWSGALIPRWHWVWQTPPVREFGPAPAQSGARSAVALEPIGASDFPGFLGAERSATVAGMHLVADWGAHPPIELWRVPVGAGWSGFAVVGGVALTQEERDGEELCVARDASDGAELWRTPLGKGYSHDMGGVGSHATPTVAHGRVYVHTLHDRLVCLEADGSIRWSVDPPGGPETEGVPSHLEYGASASPFVHENLVLVPLGGDSDGEAPALYAFDAESGVRAWRGPERFASHASPNVATLADVEQVLVVNEASVSGHALGDGRLLWELPWPGNSSTKSNNSQPTPVPPDRVLLSKGYGQGAALVSLALDRNGEWSVETLWANTRSLRTKMTNPVVHAGYVYGLSDGMLECISLTDGARVWKDGRYGHGQLLLVGDLLLLLSEEGELVLIEATPERPNSVLSRRAVLEGTTWNTFALAGDVAFVRNAREAVALRLPTVGE